MKDRIVLLDAARGLAILGILLGNISSFSHPDLVGLDFPLRWPHPANPSTTLIWWLTKCFFDSHYVATAVPQSVTAVGIDGAGSSLAAFP